MHLQLFLSKLHKNSKITITGSKSETNRLLLLQSLFPNIKLSNTSNSDDSEVMIAILNEFNQIHNIVPPLEVTELNVHHAGTAMRFLTAYFAIQPNCEIILTGSARMKERPIHILVDALNHLGAQISYEEKVGFPPLRIKGVELTKSEVAIKANTSSQYISALLLIAPKLKNGLKLHLEGEITSMPYIKMTLALLKEIGVETLFEENKITVCHAELVSASTLTVESDWSSASYYYSLVALSEIGTQITLSSYKKNSLQGDSILADIYQDFGVETVFNENETITISKVNYNGNGNGNGNISTNNNIDTNNNVQQLPSFGGLGGGFQQLPSFGGPDASGGGGYNLNNAPDIAQTIAVTCFGLGLGCHLTGLQTLKIKETDRLEALKSELSKLGATISITNDSLTLEHHDLFNSKNSPPLEGCLKDGVATYQDHRMAMAFAPLALKTSLIIEDSEVVSKSYPDFWKDLQTIGLIMKEKS